MHYRHRFALAAVLALTPLPGRADIHLVPEAVSPAVADRQAMQIPDRVHLHGWVGQRIAANEAARLASVDVARLLEGYLKRPGRQAWEGEHVGKWLHAATLAWANTGNPELRRRLDDVVATLASCQLDDGYLGTYLPKDRWTEWDVWAHKYNLIGLITYARHTGNLTPLETCRRMADLLCHDFGDAPGQRDILAAGHHVGMAPLSVLEPMVLLHRLTGEDRYLEFCHYLLRASEQPHGPRIVSTLLRTGRVNEVGNGKAYEMLSCLNGLLEMYRETGDATLLEAARRAWADVVERRLYLTGAASSRELFRGDGELPSVGDVGETCVTVTWLQFNAQLLRLTGEARFAEELERVVLNQLLGAQSPDGSAWGYYVQMESFKPYSSSLTGHCCLSSGPRGLALVPTFAITGDSDGVVINLLEAGEARVRLASGAEARVAIETMYPSEGHVKITLSEAPPAEMAVAVRIPAWARDARLSVNGEPHPGAATRPGYARVTRRWRPGDRLELHLPLEPRLVEGSAANAGSVALLHGPLVLAADEALLPAPGANVVQLCVPSGDLAALGFESEVAPGSHRGWAGARVFHIRGGVRQTSGARTEIMPVRIPLLPFAEAGGSGSRYRVWLPLAETPDRYHRLMDGTASGTAGAENPALCLDGEIGTVAVLRPADLTEPHGFTIALPRPVLIRRVRFSHGMVWGDGGWFDTSAGPPRLQIQRTSGGAWEDAAPLSGYPKTTATDGGAIAADLRKALEITPDDLARRIARHTYTATLHEPETVVGLRVVGTPSRPRPNEPGCLTCSEVQAFAD